MRRDIPVSLPATQLALPQRMVAMGDDFVHLEQIDAVRSNIVEAKMTVMDRFSRFPIAFTPPMLPLPSRTSLLS